MVDLMLDAESLGNIPGCVLCQYTIVPFNINGKPYDGPLQPLDIYLHIGQQIAEGYDVDTNTLAWWMTQPVNIRRVVFTGGVWINEFCDEVTCYYDRVVHEYKEYRLWSTSAKVDYGIPPVLFKRSDILYPVNHRAENCARTFVNMVKLNHPQMKGSKLKTTHHAIDDCRRQIDDLQIAYRHHIDKPSEEVGLATLTIEQNQALLCD